MARVGSDKGVTMTRRGSGKRKESSGKQNRVQQQMKLSSLSENSPSNEQERFHQTSK